MKKLFSLILCGLLFIGQMSFAQEVSKRRIFALQDFRGGLATKLSDQTTNPKYARIAENVRLNSSLGAITKRNQVYVYGTADTTEAITGGHRVYFKDGTKQLIVTHGDEIESGNDTTGAFTAILSLTTGEYRWTWLTWHNLAIGGDGYNQSVKYDGTTATYLGTCAAVDAGSGAGPDGTYTYKVAFYTATYTVLFDVASAPVTVSDNDISLTNIPIGPDTYLGEAITGRKVYRNTVAAPAVWNLLSNGTIANNTATTLTDSDADGAVGAAYPAGTATWTPPKGKFYLVHQNRLFIAGDPNNPSRIYYSKDGSHELFETSTDYYDIRQNDGDEITFIKNLLGILTIGKTNTIQKLYTNGDDPVTDWEISDPFSFIGCDAPYSAVNTPLGIVYLSKSKDGIYVFNGQSSILKSDQVTPVIQDISASNLISVWGEYNNNIYYLCYPSKAVGGSQNNRVLVYDMVGDSYVIDTLGINCLFSFSAGTDAGLLYGGSSTNGKVYSFGLNDQEVIHSKHTDFSGTFDDCRYIPTDVGGDSNNPILELSWDLTIDDMVGTINAQIGDVDRPDTGGTYLSPVLSTTGASAYDKVYWNEYLPSGTDATLAVRSGNTTPVDGTWSGWSSEYSTPGGSDISLVTSNNYTQYRITLSTGDIDVTPNIIMSNGYNVKLTYKTLGTALESAIAIHWQTGWLDFELPTYLKTLRKIYVTHEGVGGTLTIAVTTEEGYADTFAIPLTTYPTEYSAYFTDGALIGQKFRIDITNSDLNALKIKEIFIVYDVEPLV